MDFSARTVKFCATMPVVVMLLFTTVNAVPGESQCHDDQGCSSDKYCYAVSGRCVEFTRCIHYNRLEASSPARQPSQCGPCRPGFHEELLGTGERASSCNNIMMGTQRTEIEPTDDISWSWGPWLWGSVSLAIIFLLSSAVFWLTKYIRKNGHARIFEKVSFFKVRPTAPPQDDASYRLRGSSCDEDERPPKYSSVIGTNVDREQLVNAAPSATPSWVNKPHYDPDYNDNIADGAAMPIRSSSTNIQMDLDEEAETNPSSWTPGQLTVNLPARPFARFATEPHENVLNNALVRGNCPSNSTQMENGASDDGSEGSEDSSRPRAQGDTFCGPNVQINQTITLNIAQGGTK